MDKLNDKQQEVLDSSSNVTLVIAGAGSGKTEVLIRKIEKEILSGNNKILAITFTNKAANEIKERIEAKVGPFANTIWVNTFHSFAVKIIRIFVDKLEGFNKDFIILDEYDKGKILGDLIKKYEFEHSLGEAKYVISNAKNSALTHKEIYKNINLEDRQLYQYYNKYLKMHNAMDFDDLLLYCYMLLQDEEVLFKVRNYFNYVLVDEYQDTSHMQDEIIKRIKGEDTRLLIVGDVDQAIYGWRGAMVENILDVENRYKDVEVIKLEQNYRSTTNIIDSANLLIKNNKKRYDKNLWTNVLGGEKVFYKNFASANYEAKYVVSDIKYRKQMKKEEVVAVLYRNNSISKKIEDELIMNGISYKIYGGLKFYDRLEVKDMIAYLRLMFLDDDISFKRIYNTPRRGIGKKSYDLIEQLASDENVSLSGASRILSFKKLDLFLDKVDEYRDKVNDNFYQEFEIFLEEIGYIEYIKKNFFDEQLLDKMENIRQFIDATCEYLDKGNSITSFLSDIYFYEDNASKEEPKVILSTIHGVKGLEFDVVYIVNFNNNIIPSGYDGDNCNLEEERRLAYVAVTRAKKKLVITSNSFDNWHSSHEPSIFLEEMGLMDSKNNKFIF